MNGAHSTGKVSSRKITCFACAPLPAGPATPRMSRGTRRLSCAMSHPGRLRDSAFWCLQQPPSYRKLVWMEIESGHPFQPQRWLADIAPALLTDEQRAVLGALPARLAWNEPPAAPASVAYASLKGSVMEESSFHCLTYRILMTAFAVPCARLALIGDSEDMERGVLRIDPPSSEIAHFGFLPVQAIPHGMCAPDLIVDVLDAGQLLTTLHFCTIWRGMQRSDNPQDWERISFPNLHQAMHYNRRRLILCPFCHRLHPFLCLAEAMAAPTSLWSVLQATGLALRAHVDGLYLVVCRPVRGEQRTGIVFRYAILPSVGLQRIPGVSFRQIESCYRYLAERAVPLDGWLPVRETTQRGQG